MYWSAHVGTQENGWHDVMKNAKMVAYNYISYDPIANEHHKPRSGKKVDSSSFAVMAYEATIHSGV